MNKDNQLYCLTDEDGTKSWYLNYQRHREDGPAIEWSNGDKSWYFNGKHHRLDGPAIEWDNIAKEWWYHGKWIKCDSQEKFERLLKLKLLW